MYQTINIIPINTNNLTIDQQSVVVDLAITMNEASNNLYKLLKIFNSTTSTIGIYKFIYKLEEILITLNIINTIDKQIYDIREQSIGSKEMISIKEHSVRMFNNEKSWITSYGSLGYYLGFITNRNASYLSPSEQSHYASLCLLKLYPSYKDLAEVLIKEDKFYDDYIYNYILEVIRKVPEVAVIIRHLKVLYKYDVSKYGFKYLLTNFKEDQHLQFIFQTLSTNYMYLLQDVYTAIQSGDINIIEIPLEETTIDPIRALYDWNEALIGPGGIHTLIMLLSTTLIRRAHYLSNKAYIDNEDRIEQLISKAISLLQFSHITKDIGNSISQIITKEIEKYDNKL